MDVCFPHEQRPHTYRTNDSSIAINTVVMVPAGNEIKPTIVIGVKVYKEKAYSVVSRDDDGKPVRRGFWKMQEHINGDVTWQCSRCKATFYHWEAFCPKCHSENKKTSHDPVWVDEIEGFDAMMND